MGCHEPNAHNGVPWTDYLNIAGSVDKSIITVDLVLSPGSISCHELSEVRSDGSFVIYKIVEIFY